MTLDEIKELELILRENKWTLTTAESCTGGLISSLITSITGSSDIFRGSVITYCNDIKEQELNVKKSTLIKNGAVSVETVDEMLDGVIKKFNATYAIAVSGIAGPNGGTIEKPVGTVVIGISNIFGFKKIETYHFKGTRKNIQNEASHKALELILQKIQKIHKNS